MKQALALGLAAGMGMWTADAAAQTSFGQKGDISFAFERAMGLYSGERSFETPGGPDVDLDTSGFEFGIGGVLPHPTAMTRIGVDGFIIDHLSLGGSIGFATASEGDADGSIFLIAPRVGYFAGISRYFGFWGRGGFTYYSMDYDGPNVDAWQLMLTAEALFTFAPNDGFAFLFGPVLDLGFAGSYEPVDEGYRDRLLGLTFGLVGFF